MRGTVSVAVVTMRKLEVEEAGVSEYGDNIKGGCRMWESCGRTSYIWNKKRTQKKKKYKRKKDDGGGG